MAKTYRVGVAAMVHDHVWGELRNWEAQPGVELVAAGDVNAPLRERAHQDYGIPTVYDSWQEMLEREELDIVQAASEGQRFDEALCKRLCGGDTVTARFMRNDFFDFQPTHKLWIATNHLPEV
jgi:hypothetical protein